MSVKDFMEESEAIFGQKEPATEKPAEGGKEDGGEPDPMAQLEARLKAAEDRATAAQARLDELSNSVNRPPAEAPPKEEEITFSQDDLIDNPENFNAKLERFVQIKAKPLVNSLLNLQAQNAYRDALARHPYLKEYEGEVRKLLGQSSVAELGNARTWDTVALMIKDRHYDDIRAASNKQAPPDTVRSGNNPPAPKTRKLTPEQKFVMQRMGISEEAYLASQEALNG